MHYYWRVRSANNNAASEWSSTWTFNTNTCPTTFATIDTTIGDEEDYWFFGTVLSIPGTYTHILPNAQGCDSVVTLHLAVNHSVHDTTYITLYDTTIVHDTTYINNYIYDTTIVHDTTYINNYIHDTTIVHDTTYINNYIHDTTIVDHYIHDTTIVDHYIHDTTIVDHYIHDTTIVDHYIHDTTIITLHDTTIITLHDTTIITNTPS